MEEEVNFQKEVFNNLKKFGIIAVVTLDNIRCVDCWWNPNVAILITRLCWCGLRIVMKDNIGGHNDLICIKLCECRPSAIEAEVTQVEAMLKSENPLVLLLGSYPLLWREVFHDYIIDAEEFDYMDSLLVPRIGEWIRAVRFNGGYTHDAIYLGVDEDTNEHKIVHFAAPYKESQDDKDNPNILAKLLEDKRKSKIVQESIKHFIKGSHFIIVRRAIIPSLTCVELYENIARERKLDLPYNLYSNNCQHTVSRILGLSPHSPDKHKYTKLVTEEIMRNLLSLQDNCYIVGVMIKTLMSRTPTLNFSKIIETFGPLLSNIIGIIKTIMEKLGGFIDKIKNTVLKFIEGISWISESLKNGLEWLFSKSGDVLKNLNRAKKILFFLGDLPEFKTKWGKRWVCPTDTVKEIGALMLWA